MKKVLKNKKAFTLTEMIVVIAIMAVMTAVLAPALLQYVEKSRAQKDDSAMGELTNAIKLAMADQDVYDELLDVNEAEIAGTYADKASDEIKGFYSELKNHILSYGKISVYKF